MLKEKISLLPDSHRDALAADIDAIMYTTEGDVRIYYDDDGMFRILKHFTNEQSYFLFFLLINGHFPYRCGFEYCFSFLISLFVIHPYKIFLFPSKPETEVTVSTSWYCFDFCLGFAYSSSCVQNFILLVLSNLKPLKNNDSNVS